MEHLNEATVNEYLDAALLQEQHNAVTAHLAHCPTCRQQVEQGRQLFQVLTLQTVPEVALTSDLTAGIMGRIEADRRPARIPTWLPVLVAGQALLAVVILISFWSTARLLVIDPIIPELSQANPEMLGRQIVTNAQELWQPLAEWLDQAGQRLLARPAGSGPALAWPIVLLAGLALIVWLIGNRLLLTIPFSEKEGLNG